jgi:hypothetical protein
VESKDADVKRTDYVGYDAAGRARLVRVANRKPGGAVQVQATAYDYNDAQRQLTVTYPLGKTEVSEYNDLGELRRKTERNGLVHEYFYNAVGLLTRDEVAQSAANIDTAVSARTFRYNTLGDLVLATSLAGGGRALDQVKREYNGFGQLVEEYQEHHGEVAEDTSQKVQYAYQYINHDSRLQSVIYPSGFTLTYGYDESPGPAIGRVSSVAQDGQVLESYTYRGVDTLAGSTLPELGVTRTLQLDAFDRLQQIAWNEGPTLVAGYAYGHDPDNDLLWRNDLAAPDSLQLDEAYAYNGLEDQKSFQRGVLSADGQLGDALPLISWDLDSQGNRYSDTYAHDYNAENKDAPLSDFDALGCETTIELASGATASLAFDAWSEATQILPSPSLPSKGVAANAADAKDAAVGFVYRYDALGRQISLCQPDPGSKSGDGSSATTDKYYLGDQPVEELDENTVVHLDRAYSPADGRPMLLIAGALQRQYALSDGSGRTVAQVTQSDTGPKVLQRYAFQVDSQPETLPGDFATPAKSDSPVTDITLDGDYRYQAINAAGDGIYVDPHGTMANPANGRIAQSGCEEDLSYAGLRKRLIPGTKQQRARDVAIAYQALTPVRMIDTSGRVGAATAVGAGNGATVKADALTFYQIRSLHRRSEGLEAEALGSGDTLTQIGYGSGKVGAHALHAAGVIVVIDTAGTYVASIAGESVIATAGQTLSYARVPTMLALGDIAYHQGVTGYYEAKAGNYIAATESFGDSGMSLFFLGSVANPNLFGCQPPAAPDATDLVIDRYGTLGQSSFPGQAHHLNQAAAYGEVIPYQGGLAIKLEGNILSDVGAPHTLAHESLENFWWQYRGTGLVPTNLQYTQALRESLRAAGLAESQVQQAIRAAIRERVQFGLLGGRPVPRVPGPIPNLAR